MTSTRSCGEVAIWAMRLKMISLRAYQERTQQAPCCAVPLPICPKSK
jgi:hypothetical protein